MVGRPAFVVAIITLGVDVVGPGGGQRRSSASTCARSATRGAWHDLAIGGGRGAAAAPRDAARRRPCWSRRCSRSSGTPGWAWRCGPPRTTRRPRWPRASRSARCSPLSWAIAGGAGRGRRARSSAPAAASTADLWLIALVALPVIILGGLDSLPGAVVGGLVVGVVQELVGHVPEHFAPLARRQRLGHHAVRGDAAGPAGAPVRPVRHPGGGAGMSTRSGGRCCTPRTRRTWRCSTPGQAGRRSARCSSSALALPFAARPTSCCSCWPPAASRRSARSGSTSSPGTPARSRSATRSSSASAPTRRPSISGDPDGRTHRLRHHRHPGLAAGRRPRRRARRACSWRRWPPGCAGSTWPSSRSGLVFIGEHFFNEWAELTGGAGVGRPAAVPELFGVPARRRRTRSSPRTRSCSG